MDKRQALLGYGEEEIEHSGKIGVPIVYMDPEKIELERERLFRNDLKIRGIN